MMARRGVLGLLSALAGGVVLGGCDLLGGGGYRYKMTVEVETPEGLRQGHAVRQVSFYSRPQGVYGAKVQGEAVAVDLPGGQVLFALLSAADGYPDYAAWIADWALKRELKPGGANAGYDAGDFAELWPTQAKTHNPIGQTRGPMLVRFHDLADPTSVEWVEAGDLAASFGPGVALKRVTVERTSDAVTNHVSERLIWFNRYKNLQLDGRRYNDSQEFPNTFNRLNFSQGVVK